MSTDVGRETGKVLAVSVAIAGFLSGLGVMLRGRTPASKQRAALESEIETRQIELDKLDTSIADRKKELNKLVKKSSPTQPINLDSVDWEKLSKQSRKALDKVRGEVSRLAANTEVAVESGQKSARKLADTIAQRAPEVLASAESGIATATQTATEEAKTAAGKGSQVASAIVDLALKQMSQKNPMLGQIARKALPIKAQPTTKDKAAKVLHKTEDAFARELKKAEDALSTATTKVTTAAREDTKKVKAKVEEATRRKSRSAKGLLFWASAAAGTVYFGILNDEQRAQVNRAASAVAREATSVYGEIREQLTSQ